MTWESRAACRSSDPEIFDRDTMDLELAKSICEACPVVVECLEDASREDRIHTIRGGRAPSEGIISETSELDLEFKPCKRGHVGSWIPAGGSNAQYRCKECKRAADRASADRKRAGITLTREPRPEDTCVRGHVGHYKIYAGNKKRCKECVREWNASRYSVTMNA